MLEGGEAADAVRVCGVLVATAARSAVMAVGIAARMTRHPQPCDRAPDR
jgi:hypothetical protein